MDLLKWGWLSFVCDPTVPLLRSNEQRVSTYRVTIIERITAFLKGVQIFHIVFGFVGGICDPRIQLSPALQKIKIQEQNFI